MLSQIFDDDFLGSNGFENFDRSNYIRYGGIGAT